MKNYTLRIENKILDGQSKKFVALSRWQAYEFFFNLGEYFY